MQSVLNNLHYYITPFTGLSLILFFSILLVIVRLSRKVQEPRVAKEDLNAIAGDDVITTQLDLARAYIEMGQKKLAADILRSAKKNGNPAQKSEAKRLCALL